MIAELSSNPADPLASERVLIVGSGALDDSLMNTVRVRYPDLQVSSCDSYMAAVVDLCRRPARAVIAAMDPAVSSVTDALAGLREAAGTSTRVVLCCRPEVEPIARKALVGGADDYLLLPVDEAELDAAIGYPRLREETAPKRESLGSQELTLLADAIQTLGTAPRSTLEKAAATIREAINARGVLLVVEGTVVTSGDPVSRPVLTAPLSAGQRVLGHVSLGERVDGAYTPADVERLAQYATLTARLLEASSTQREWQRLALTDEVTGLPNRRHFQDRLRQVLSLAAAERFPVTLLLFDVDDFKSYNDRFGHESGDEILQIIGRLFRQYCREQDLVARYGGDEFAVVFWDSDGSRVPGSKNLDSALIVLERFREALRSQKLSRVENASDAIITISGGLAAFPWDGTTPSELIHRADEALLAAKSAGKNRTFPVTLS